MFPFSVYFGPKKLKLYALKSEDQQKWVSALKDAIGYSSFNDYYELKVCLFNE